MTSNNIGIAGSSSPSRILVPTDGSPNANRALDIGISLARTNHAELVILNVIAIPISLVSSSAIGMAPSGLDSYYEQQEANAKSYVSEAVADAKTQGVMNARSRVVRAAESVVAEIINEADHDGIDLIVIGTRGLGGFKRLVQGSVSSGVVAHANCNVLVVR